MMIKKGVKTFFRYFLLAVVIFLLVGYFSGFFLVTSTYQVASSKLPASFDGYTIVQLSDYHSANLFHNRVLERIRKIDPDLVVMTGDMITNKSEDFEDFLTLAKEITADYLVYYIVGNHEQGLAYNHSVSSDRLDQLLTELAEEGVHILDNEKISLTKGSDSIDLYGLWFNLRYYNNPQGDTSYTFGSNEITQLLGTKSDHFSILLTHNPGYFATYSKWGADLTLTGHIHGGIIRLPILGGVLSPDYVFFPQYDKGAYYDKDHEMIVSSGIGSGSIIPRFYNCPEVVKIVLQKK